MCAPSDFFLGLLGILFPPLPVWIKTGICSGASLLNILLCILGYLPGLIHSWYIIASVPDPPSAAYYYYEEVPQGDLEAGHVARSRGNAYYIVRVPPMPAGTARPNGSAGGYVSPQPPSQQPKHTVSAPARERTYGTVETAATSAGPSNEQSRPEFAPPSYDQAIRGDNKVQK